MDEEDNLMNSCPDCDQHDKPPTPKIVVVKRRESPRDKWKGIAKSVGIGLGVLLFFLFIGSLMESSDDSQQDGTKDIERSVSSVVAKAIESLLDYRQLPNERRQSVLAENLAKCPVDFQEAVSEYLSAYSKTVDDMITSKEREEVINGAIVGGVLFGALGAGELGGQLSELQCAELEEKARRRLRHKRESAVNHLVEVAQKYGINPKVLEEALLDR